MTTTVAEAELLAEAILPNGVEEGRRLRLGMVSGTGFLFEYVPPVMDWVSRHGPFILVDRVERTAREVTEGDLVREDTIHLHSLEPAPYVLDVDYEVRYYFRTLNRGGLVNVWRPEVRERIQELMTPEMLDKARMLFERNIARSKAAGLY